MILKHGSKIGTATVRSNALLKAGAMIPNSKIVPKSCTAHNTGNWDVPADNYYRSLKRQNDTKPDTYEASYHFVVDDKEIIQIIDTLNKTWHAGKGNSSSIGVEICMFKDKARHEKAKKNAQLLIVELLKGHKLGSSVVYSHNYWTGKNCPQTILAEKNGWSNFTSTIKELYVGNTSTPSFKPYTVKVTADVLNVRKGAGTNYPVTTQVKKGEVYTIVDTLNGWGKLKSGVGWISLQYTIKQ